MKIYIENELLEYANNVETTNKMFREIDEIVEKYSKIISHMIVDGIEIFGDYDEYFASNISFIKEVHVIAHTYQELVDDILKSTWVYIERIPAGIEDLTNNFYKNPQGQDWNDLNDFLGGLHWIISTYSTIDQDTRLKDVVADYKHWNTYAKEISSLTEILPDFEDALSSNDHISIADILSYEMLPTLANMGQVLLKLVDVEVSIDGLN